MLCWFLAREIRLLCKDRIDTRLPNRFEVALIRPFVIFREPAMFLDEGSNVHALAAAPRVLLPAVPAPHEVGVRLRERLAISSSSW